MKRGGAFVFTKMSGALGSLMASIFLYGCSPLLEESSLDAGPLSYARSAQYSWMLPKTIVSVSVTYTLTSCSEEKGIEVSPAVTLANISEPDTNLGPEFPDGIIAVQPEELKSFWQDRNVSVKTNPTTHVLSYLGSSPTNQVGAIVGSVITSAAKLAAVGFGVPAVAAVPADAPKPKFCGKAAAALAQIQTYKDKLADPSVAASDVKDLPGLIQSLQAGLSITVQKNIEPGITPTRIDPKNPSSVHWRA